MEELAHILGRLPRNLVGNGARAELARVVWSRVVGPKLAAHSRVVALGRGSLAVEADTSPWAREIEAAAPTLVARIREGYPTLNVRRLRVRVASEPVFPEAAPEEQREAPQAGPPAEVALRAGTIRDPALREALLRTAGAYLARRERAE